MIGIVSSRSFVRGKVTLGKDEDQPLLTRRQGFASMDNGLPIKPRRSSWNLFPFPFPLLQATLILPTQPVDHHVYKRGRDFSWQSMKINPADLTKFMVSWWLILCLPAVQIGFYDLRYSSASLGFYSMPHLFIRVLLDASFQSTIILPQIS